MMLMMLLLRPQHLHFKFHFMGMDIYVFCLCITRTCSRQKMNRGPTGKMSMQLDLRKLPSLKSKNVESPARPRAQPGAGSIVCTISPLLLSLSPVFACARGIPAEGVRAAPTCKIVEKMSGSCRENAPFSAHKSPCGLHCSYSCTISKLPL